MRYFILLTLTVLMLTSCSEKGCVGIVEGDISTIDDRTVQTFEYTSDEFAMSIPAYVSTNGDQLNDTFFVVSNFQMTDLRSASFKVRDDCDNLIHVSTNEFPFKWDGINAVAQGKYTYSFSVQFNNGKIIAQSNSISIYKE